MYVYVHVHVYKQISLLHVQLAVLKLHCLDNRYFIVKRIEMPRPIVYMGLLTIDIP